MAVVPHETFKTDTSKFDFYGDCASFLTRAGQKNQRHQLSEISRWRFFGPCRVPCLLGALFGELEGLVSYFDLGYEIVADERHFRFGLLTILANRGGDLVSLFA